MDSMVPPSYSCHSTAYLINRVKIKKKSLFSNKPTELANLPQASINFYGVCRNGERLVLFSASPVCWICTKKNAGASTGSGNST